jgi:flagellin
MSTLSINNNMMSVDISRNLTGHYAGLAASVRRLASGLRVSRAADDAAGLAIRELMRANIAAFNQGVRNVNDAISLIQTADGALAVIDEKLVRMKELAEQAATGTYTSTQRLMIDSEYQAMGAEINRIANATTFNGVHLLNGNLNGTHDGSGLAAAGALKIHFGPGNAAAEDYYYIGIGDCTLQGLGLSAPVGAGSGGGAAGVGGNIGKVPVLSGILGNGASLVQFRSGLVSFGVIPKGTKNVEIFINDCGQDDTLQLFTTSGKHISGTIILGGGDWNNAGVTEANVDTTLITAANGFDTGASYDGSEVNGTGKNLPYTEGPDNSILYNGMHIGYSGSGNSLSKLNEYLTIDEVTEDLIVIASGGGVFLINASWEFMPATASSVKGGGAASIRTQAEAQGALEKIDTAIAIKDTTRADLGALQNRLENTASNLRIQAENLQAAESRISDVDVAREMTQFVRNQILASSATAMLAQANTMPRMLMRLLE